MTDIPVGKKCCVIGCADLQFSGHLCAKHYKRKQRYGDPTINKREKPQGVPCLEKHPLYTTWRSVVRYDKGLSICARWKKFENFIEDVGGRPSAEVRFRRIDASKLFEPGNVFWQEPVNSRENRELAAEMARERNRANPDYARNASLKKLYGVTLDWYNIQHDLQQGKCRICGEAEKVVIRGKLSRLSVDHCHETGKVRGLLCAACNTAIGLLKHDVNLLTSAINYLNKYG